MRSVACFSSRAWFQLATWVPMNTPTMTIANSMAIADQFWPRRPATSALVKS